MASYIPSTLEERQEMLRTVGVSSFRELYRDVPAQMYLENGLVGLVFYLGFFVLSFITTFRYAKRTHINRSYLIIAEIIL